MNQLLRDPVVFASTFQGVISHGPDLALAFLAQVDEEDWQRLDESFQAFEPPVAGSALISWPQFVTANDSANGLLVTCHKAGILLGVAVEQFRQMLIKREEQLASTRPAIVEAADAA